jgi:hypothetical protein
VRRRAKHSFKSLLIVSAVAATFGMEVDVCSGPLSAHEGLAVLLDLPGRVHAGGGPGTAAASADACGRSRVDEPGRGQPRKAPRGTVSVADWPASRLVLKCRQGVKRNVTLTFALAAELPERAAVSRPSLLDDARDARCPSPVDLCRLNC